VWRQLAPQFADSALSSLASRLPSAQARLMLAEGQQPLRIDVREAVEEAVRTGSRVAFLRAIEVARSYGYT